MEVVDPQERESDLGDDSPVSPNDEEISDGDAESGREADDVDSSEEAAMHDRGVGVIAEHGDVLAKLKMQVRDIKVGDDFDNAARNLAYSSRQDISSFHLPAPFPFPHPPTFMPPILPPPNASSGSSHSSEGSNASSTHNPTWSFEEQFKQLYDISDDPRRKEFLDDLFLFMTKRGTPINRLPIMAKSVLDLYELYNLVVARGGLVDVINKKLWQEIIKGLNLPSSITSAAFTLRTQYMKYLYPYENEKLKLSTSTDLQVAIDGNRREGRRSSYGQYDSVQRPPNPQNMSPLSIVSQQQFAARMNSVMAGGMALQNGAHHPSHPQPLSQPLNGGPVPGSIASEMEAQAAQVLKYVNLLSKEMQGSTPPLRPGQVSPPTPLLPLTPLELSRLTLWNMYSNNQPPIEPQKEALNLSEPAQPVAKRDAPSHHIESPPPKKVAREEEDQKPFSCATHITINSRRDTRNGDSSLVVSMELNGVPYQGVLFAQNAPSSSRSAQSS